MGTPHQGSAQATWGGMLASMLGLVKQDNVNVVKNLEKNASSLMELQKRFYTLLANRREEGKAIEITCFYEELPLPIIGTIVPSHSATMMGFTSVGTHANHMEMTKFGSDDSPGYVKILGELRRWIRSWTSERNEEVEQKNDSQPWVPNAKSEGIHVEHHGNVAEGGAGVYGNQRFGNHTRIGGAYKLSPEQNSRTS
ncbi:hypothetical protein H2199_001968 [Coniosporium tulheliwenetii]|uniref:Uncharacterized protein n=1 Tax=Coniosporium tulheliwenetii TaxID=3383036 RepID=A0ACC2ZGQ0_9PEZI|nr:hypothetical protein H2199_001968 [Cladosporium sp. JES 115]